MAGHFSGLEADGTFYRLQKRTTFENWAARVPDDFSFCIRGHRYTTHNKKLLDAPATILKQKEPAEGFGKKLEVVVWQLPPKFAKNRERLGAFCEALKEHWSEVRHSIEFRHESWMDDEIASLLEKFKIANCISDSGSWKRWDAVTTDLAYVRLHGKPHTYWSGYDGADLDDWATKAEQWLADGRDVHIYFDNDANLRAPYDATGLLERIRAKAG